jgi:CRP/FNR family transcriptional regulator
MLETRHGPAGPPIGQIFLPMSRANIGQYAGLSVEAVCRALRSLVGCGAIAMRDRRHVTIVDQERLEAAIAEPRAPRAARAPSR